ncbi:DMT family transporter [Aestuariispira insulae]|uniref:Drug/metabolite transporter (DMT)-like permease n=1 Tax=Aestuariispira insulae TaxID=1461337 RepID=A0A3D9HXJ0_9PROT|nr:DMT family transporter [Aestuariispira insulae]RED54222.1 drug/metabolite transporter (DMT)-like permease [Aestuariispira insulae]
MTSQAVQDPRDTLRGMAHMMASMLTFAVMDALIKHLGHDYPVTQIVFFRCLAAMIPVGILLYRAGGLKILKTEQPGLHLLRALFGMTAMYCVFTSFTLMPLADAIAINFSAPLFMTLLSIPLLGEKVGLHRLGAVLAGFAGVVIIMAPGAEVIGDGTWIALTGAFFIALAMITVRKLSRKDHVVAITTYFTLAGIIVGAIGVGIQGWRTPPLEDFILLMMVGILGGIAQFSMTSAFRLAELSVVAPFEYTQILWGAIIAYLFWQEAPDTRLYAGAVFIAASGLYIMHRETRNYAPGQRRKWPRLWPK